jgi:hypothetical protein
MIYEEWDKLKLHSGKKGLIHMFAIQLLLTWVQFKLELSEGLPDLQITCSF